MIELDPSLHNFDPQHFGRLIDFLSTSDRNERDTLMIACSDHGTAPDNVSFAGPDRFFILQHLAASIPPQDGEPHDLFDSVRIAFRKYDIKQIVVCGHLGCGVIPNWMKDSCVNDLAGMRSRFLSQTLKTVQETYPNLKGRELIECLICEHALFQLENLQAHPFVQQKLEANEVKLHLWIVNDDTARVLSFDPNSGSLVPIEKF